MRDSVRAAFNAFTDRFEGKVGWMYPDIRGLITTGRGNLIDPVAAALELPWGHADSSSAATQDEIRAEWSLVKSSVAFRMKGAGYFARITSLRLSEAAIDELCVKRLEGFEVVLRRYNPGYDSWCADAQLGILSMSWAMGSAFEPVDHFVGFQAAANAGRWDECAGAAGDANTDKACRGLAWINDTGNPGVRPRNLANKVLFHNAALVAELGADPAALYYPGAPVAPPAAA